MRSHEDHARPVDGYRAVVARMFEVGVETVIDPEFKLVLIRMDKILREEHEERAAIMEHCGGMTRRDAELLAAEDVFARRCEGREGKKV